MSAQQDYFIVAPGSLSAQSYAENIEAANARLDELRIEQPEICWKLVDPDRFLAEKETQLLTEPVEIDRSAFDEALNVLPPLDWRHDSGIERFNMVEFTSGRITQQYARVGDRYFTKPVRHRDVSTYITAQTALDFPERTRSHVF